MENEIIISIISSGFVSSLVVWLTKTWISERLKDSIKHEYAQKLETYKAELKAVNDVELEKLRSNLNILACERQIEFSKLQEKRTDTIEKMYSLLKDVYLAIEDYTKIFVPVGDKSQEEKRNIVYNTYDSFNKYYHHKIIFLPFETVKSIDQLNKEFVEVFNKFRLGVELKSNEIEKTNVWEELYSLKESMTKSLEKLENDFRLLVGDKSNLKKESKSF